jgi:hypothetical protein
MFLRILASVLLLSSFGSAQITFFGQNYPLTVMTSGDLPTPPAYAYVYANLQTQSSSCPTSINPAANSSSNTTNCWGANSADATGLAGAGVIAPTQVLFGNTSIEAPGSTTGSMTFSVTNPTTETPTATGTSGASSIVVSSITGIGSNFRVSGTGIGSGAQVSTSWNGTSTTIPLTVANTGTVSGTVSFAFTANALFPNHLSVTLQPTVPSAVTTGTLTVNAGTVVLNSNATLSITGATATDDTYSVVAMQVYVDNALYFSDASTAGSGPAGQSGSPYSPLTYTTGVLANGSHTIGVKAFNSNDDSTLVSFSISIGGASIATVSNLLDDFWYYLPSGQAMEAFEVDPDIFNYNPNLSGCSGTSCSTHMEASMQCDIASGSDAPNQWRFWNTATDHWVRADGSQTGTTGTSYSCSPAMTTGVWHHYQLYATYNVVAETYAYQTLVIDGVTVFKNLNLGYSGAVTGYATSTNFISVQNQIDLTSSSSQTTPTPIYYDRYSLTAW